MARDRMRDPAGQPVTDEQMSRRRMPTEESAGEDCTERMRSVPSNSWMPRTVQLY